VRQCDPLRGTEPSLLLLLLLPPLKSNAECERASVSEEEREPPPLIALAMQSRVGESVRT
jgi:hypothetical protein